jgi:hypothetical protein
MIFPLVRLSRLLIHVPIWNRSEKGGGRGRWGAAKTIHGRETRAIRDNTSSKLKELYELEIMARAAGVITGPKVRGRTPGS